MTETVKCEICNGSIEYPGSYVSYQCLNCGQKYIYEECQFIVLTNEQKEILKKHALSKQGRSCG